MINAFKIPVILLLIGGCHTSTDSCTQIFVVRKVFDWNASNVVYSPFIPYAPFEAAAFYYI